ncbi:MAG: hypothetical protein SP4CHLAM5_12020 [Chlamydiia bacterium]|nr:hypothetical protein [Chlamydiia bacterium]MCH9619056.1 hypothetical protein [Chlamydiia bacterium]
MSSVAKVAPETQVPNREAAVSISNSDVSDTDYKVSFLAKVCFFFSNCCDGGATNKAIAAFKAEMSPIKQQRQDANV